MRISYVAEDTDLWGGVAIIFQHLEILAEGGHDAFLSTPGAKPDWYPLKVPLNRIKDLTPSSLPKADILVSTSWRTIKPVVESEKGIAAHLCQGYEGALMELNHLKNQIDQAHSLGIPELTVSPHLEKLLKEKFHSETYYVGQMINREIFHPNINRLRQFQKIRHKPRNILVVGPFHGSYKNIPTILRGIRLARNRLKDGLRLIRVSQFPLSSEEEEIIKPDAYFCRVPYPSMGGIYRAADIFISLSTAAEGFGLPSLEAMACGVPTILSKIPSHLAFDDSPGYALFVESESEAVFEAILNLLENGRLRRKLTKRGFAVASKFTKEALLSRLTDVFELLISRS